MKSLFIIRHAKSSWEFTSLNDLERPLNDRGKEDAPEMAARLSKRIQVDAFISSPAKRAKKTAQLFAAEFRYKKEDIIYIDSLYNAPVDVFYKTVTNLDDVLSNVAIFAHNPGITDFVNTLTEIRIDNVPTCGIFGIKVYSGIWQDFATAKKEFWFFDYPKLKHG